MAGLSIGVAIACVLAVYIGSAVQASVGVGLGMLSSPVLALSDPDFIPVVIVMAVLPLTGAMAWSERSHVERRDLAVTLGARVPGVALGAAVAAWSSDELLGVLVAGSVLLAVVVSITTRRFSPSQAARIGAGFTSGFMGTSTGVGGPPMALAYQHSDPPTMRGTISAYFAVGAVMSLGGLAIAGEIGRRQLELGALVLPGVFLGVATARLVRDRLNPQTVRAAVLVVCAVSALALLIKTLT